MRGSKRKSQLGLYEIKRFEIKRSSLIFFERFLDENIFFKKIIPQKRQDFFKKKSCLDLRKIQKLYHSD